MKPLRLLAIYTLIITASIQIHAEDWPVFRGPHQDGISKETDFKTEGDAAILWKTTVGLGHSAFTVANGLAYITGHDGENTGTVFCFDAISGAEKWKYKYENPLDPNSYAGGTTGAVTIHKGVAYHLARRGLLTALDAKTGTVKWKKHIQKEYEISAPTWGFTGAPVILDDALFLAAGEGGTLIKMADGSLILKSKKETGYSTPYLFEKNGERLAIVSHKRGYKCVVPATGKEYWNLKWMTSYGVNATEPIVSGDNIFISTGYGKGATLLKWGGPGSGDPQQVWKSRDMKNQMNPSILVDGFLYGIDGNERHPETGLKCMEMATGATKWIETGVGHGAITVAGKHLLVATEQGKFQIAPISTESYQPTLDIQAVKGRVWTVPVLANGIAYLRNGQGEVAAVDLRK